MSYLLISEAFIDQQPHICGHLMLFTFTLIDLREGFLFVPELVRKTSIYMFSALEISGRLWKICYLTKGSIPVQVCMTILFLKLNFKRLLSCGASQNSENIEYVSFSLV